MVAPLYYTAQMVRELPDDGMRYETVHGELLVTPSPAVRHQRIAGRLVFALHAYLRQEPVAELFFAPADVSWGLGDVLVQPDIFAIRAGDPPITRWDEVQRLLLAIEITSPSSTRADRFTKRRLYQEQGTPLYWMVDPDAESVEVWTPTDELPRVAHDVLTWHPPAARSPFTLDLPPLFAPLAR